MNKNAGLVTPVLALVATGAVVSLTLIGVTMYKNFTGTTVLGDMTSPTPVLKGVKAEGLRVYPKRMPSGETTPVIVEGKLTKGFTPDKITVRLASRDAAVAEFPSGVKAVPTVVLVDELGNKFPASVKCLDFVGRKVVDDVYVKEEVADSDSARPDLKAFKSYAIGKPMMPAKDETIGTIPNTGLLKPGVTPKTDFEEELKRPLSKPGLKPYLYFQCDVVYPKVPVATDKVEVMVRNLGALCDKPTGCMDINVEVTGQKTRHDTNGAPELKKYSTKSTFTK